MSHTYNRTLTFFENYNFVTKIAHFVGYMTSKHLKHNASNFLMIYETIQMCCELA